MRNVIFGIFLALPYVAEIASAQEQSKNFEGTWIIAPHPHDSVIESGLSGGEYPVLIISETGNIRAYRFGVKCGFDNLSFEDNDAEISSQKKRCIDSFPLLQNDLHAAPATLVFEGKLIKENASAWRIDSQDKAHLHSKIKSIKAQLARTDEIPIAYFIFHRLLTKKFELTPRGTTLTMHSTDGKWHAEFVKVIPENLTDTGSTLWHLFAPYREYFRCLLNIYSIQNSTTPSANELRELRSIVRKYAHTSNAMDNIRFKMEFVSETEKRDLNHALISLASEQDSLEAQLASTPAYLASEKHTLGQYLNCRERDYK